MSTWPGAGPSNLERMRNVKKALYGLTEEGMGIPWPKGVHSAVKFSTEMLQADIEEGGYGIMTHPRQAEQLLRLDTVERRVRAEGEAHTRGNLQGGLHSQNLHRSVNELLVQIQAGTEGHEMYAERVARQAREREAELRKTHPGAIYYPPEMRKS